MNLPEAIKRLNNEANTAWNEDRLKDADACQLGIEALKERQEAIRQGLPLWHELLPGETKD